MRVGLLSWHLAAQEAFLKGLSFFQLEAQHQLIGAKPMEDPQGDIAGRMHRHKREPSMASRALAAHMHASEALTIAWACRKRSFRSPTLVKGLKNSPSRPDFRSDHCACSAGARHEVSKVHPTVTSSPCHWCNIPVTAGEYKCSPIKAPFYFFNLIFPLELKVRAMGKASEDLPLDVIMVKPTGQRAVNLLLSHAHSGQQLASTTVKQKWLENT